MQPKKYEKCRFDALPPKPKKISYQKNFESITSVELPQQALRLGGPFKSKVRDTLNWVVDARCEMFTGGFEGVPQDVDSEMTEEASMLFDELVEPAHRLPPEHQT